MNEVKYAELIDRIKATFADMIVTVALGYMVADLIATYEYVPIWVRALALIAVFGLYDPIFVSLFGGTIGHFICRLRVKRSGNHKRNIFFPLAIVRYALKVFLGIISLFTVSSNSESKAIHDMAVNSVVLKV